MANPTTHRTKRIAAAIHNMRSANPAPKRIRTNNNASISTTEPLYLISASFRLLSAEATLGWLHSPG